jgi:hypothetical protein
VVRPASPAGFSVSLFANPRFASPLEWDRSSLVSGGKEYEERLIYIARVTGKLEGQDYYQQRQYASRPDCIYRVDNGRAVLKASARYHTHSDERKKDVGFHFEDASVLLSNDFRYLGKTGTDDYKNDRPEIGKLIEKLKRGHRRHHSTELRTQLLKMKSEIWATYRRMEVGSPTDDDFTRLCNDDDSPSADC